MRTPAKSFQDLTVWQKAHAFVLQVYAATRRFPKEELYGLSSQFRARRCPLPPTSPKASGNSRNRIRPGFLNISEGSLEECRYYLILAHDLGHLDKRPLWELADEVARLLYAYRSAILTPDS